MPFRYTGSIQKQPTDSKPREKEINNSPCPYLEPSYSKKLTREEGLKTINTLTQDQRLHTKEYFSLWSENTSFPKANKFLSFQTDQNIHKGVICHAFLRVFPTNAPCHPRRVEGNNGVGDLQTTLVEDNTLRFASESKESNGALL